MILDSPIISGSSTVTGDLTVLGTLTANVSGSTTSASYATNAELLDGLDSTSFTTTSSFNTASGSFSTRVTNLESFSSSLDATFATDAELTAVSQSFSSSLSTVSGSLSSRVANNEATGSSLTTASSSFSTRVTNTEATASSLVTASGSFSTRTTNLETASGSFSTRVSSLETASGSFSTRVTSAEGSITSLNNVSGSYATTGSNSFSGSQVITGSLTTTGQIIAQTLNVQQVTSSIVYSSGSNIFGNSVSNTQQFTGSLQVSGSTHYLLGGVGIGTTSPVSRLNVFEDNITVSAGYGIAWSGDQTRIITPEDNVQGARIKTPGGFLAEASVFKFISGSVGIGTTSPTELLQVAGNIRLGGTAAYNSILLHNSGSTGGGGVLAYQNNVPQAWFGALGWYEGNTAVGAVIGTDSASRPIVFYTSTERMRITGAGQVGIGTTSPGTAKLYILGQGSGGFNTIFEDNTSPYCWVQIKASGGGSNSSWQLGSYNNGFNFYNDNNGQYRVFFGDNGNVGIGTTSPTTKLTIDNSANPNTNHIDFVGYASTTKGHIGNFSNGLYLTSNYYYAGGQNNDNSSYGQASILIAAGTTTTSTISFALSDAGATSPSTKVLINSAGNVGIGTTSPGGSLEVVGSGSVISRFNSTATNGGVISFQRSGTAILDIGTGLGLLGVGTNNDSAIYSTATMYLGANGTQFVTLRSGNVGIGTTSPNAPLQIANGSGGSRKIVLWEGANNNYEFYGFGVETSTLVYSTYTTGDDHVFFAGTGASSRNELMRIKGTGNVGIGTTSPDILLTVDGKTGGASTVNIARFYASKGQSDAAYLNVQGTRHPTASVQRMVLEALNGAGTSVTLALNPNGGNVGIGTTSPDAVFHVAKATSSGVGGQIVIDNPASSAVGNTAEISFLTDAGASGAGTRNARILVVNDNASNGAANMQFHTWNGSLSDERMRISNAGNVGIGTTSPNAKLDVYNGNARFWHGNTAYYTQFENSNEINTYTSAGAISTMFLNWISGGDVSIARNAIVAKSAGNVGIGRTSPLSKLAVYGGPVQIMQDYPGHQLIIRSAGTSGTYNGSLTITIPEMNGAGSSQGYGGYSCEVYVAGYLGQYCHAWFSGYINNGISASEATILRSNGGWSISQVSTGTWSQGFIFTIDYPAGLIHPTARIIFNKGGDPNILEYDANAITAVWS